MHANLHLHSRYSDGSLWPERIAELAAGSGLAMAALTDHDTLAGCARFADAARKLGLATVNACEIDCVAPEIGYRSELLAYFPRGAYAATAALLGSVLAARRARLERFVERARTLFRRPELGFDKLLARKLGPEIPPEGAPEGLSFNKVDFFTYLKAEGVIEPSVRYREFGRAYFDSGLIRQERFPKPEAEEVAAAARADGGLLVLPHPGHQFGDDPARMKREQARVYELLAWFRDRGVAGVELYWYGDAERSAPINKLVAGLAAELGLFVTYGSDCHGPGSEKHTLGKFAGDFGGFPEVACPTA
ncbi:MAG TPA: PHP domain-containing protein [Spirochaetia bacterium]|nr:PHP domain-containing protein [Spirochaetia bacterium]